MVKRKIKISNIIMLGISFILLVRRVSRKNYQKYRKTILINFVSEPSNRNRSELF